MPPRGSKTRTRIPSGFYTKHDRRLIDDLGPRARRRILVPMFSTTSAEPVKEAPAAPKTETVVAATGKKSCCVIGAGASGLTVMKELASLGHTVRWGVRGGARLWVEVPEVASPSV